MYDYEYYRDIKDIEEVKNAIDNDDGYEISLDDYLNKGYNKKLSKIII